MVSIQRRDRTDVPSSVANHICTVMSNGPVKTSSHEYEEAATAGFSVLLAFTGSRGSSREWNLREFERHFCGLGHSPERTGSAPRKTAGSADTDGRDVI